MEVVVDTCISLSSVEIRIDREQGYDDGRLGDH